MVFDRRRVARGWVLAVFALSLGGGPAYAQSAPGRAGGSISSVEKQVGTLYFRSARDLFRSGKNEEAATLLDIALEYDSGNSDIHYLLGRILSDRQETVARAITELQTAIGLDSFQQYLPSDCAITLARLYLRTGRYADGLALLQRFAGSSFVDLARFRPMPDRSLLPGSDTRKSPDVLTPEAQPIYLTTLSQLLVALNRQGQAHDILQQAMRLFPASPEIAHEALMLDPVPSLGTTAWLEDHVSSLPAYLSFLMDYVRRLPDGQLRQRMLGLYFDHGGDAPEAWALSAGGAKSDAEALKGFLSAGGLPHPAGSSGPATPTLGATAQIGPVRTLAERLTDHQSQADLASRLSTFSGTFGVDKNGDGYFEALLTFERGKLTRWTADTNQDGQPEFVAVFDGSRIDTLVEYLKTGTVTIQYGPYPIVASARFSSSTVPPFRGDSVNYSILPGRLSIPILKDGTAVPAAGLTVTDAVQFVTPKAALKEDVVRAISSEADSDGSNGLSRLMYLRAGAPYLVVSFEQKSGIVRDVVEYRNGLPLAGIRDLNGDGYFDESEFFTNGNLSYLAVDENHDGAPDFFQQISPAASTAWDLNGDGKVDIKDMVIGAQEVRRLYSRELNGRLDGSRIIQSPLPPQANGGAAAR